MKNAIAKLTPAVALRVAAKLVAANVPFDLAYNAGECIVSTRHAATLDAAIQNCK